MTIEDFSGSAEVLIFPEKWATLNDQIRTDVPMLLKGAYSRRDEGGDNPAYIVDSATKLAEMRTNGQVTVAIDLSKGAYSGDVMSDVRAIAETYPGSAPLEFRWSDGTAHRRVFRRDSLWQPMAQRRGREQSLRNSRVRRVPPRSTPTGELTGGISNTTRVRAA